MLSQNSQSPFPGMDPYLEDPAIWPEFHRRLVAVLHELLLPGLVGRYKCEIGRWQSLVGAGGHEEDCLEIREARDGRLVTRLDIVSPLVKATGTGRQTYLERRRAGRDSKVNLVEIDLVLQGQPILDYSRDGLPPWDYAVTVLRSTSPDRHEIYTSTLQKRLPRFRVPLAADDRDTVLDLQAGFAQCYAAGGYFGRIDYCREPAVPLPEEGRRWLDATLTSQGLRGPSPSQEEVALAAYYIWEQEGRLHGDDTQHWDKALAKLRRQKG